jgi:hypothetical protein
MIIDKKSWIVQYAKYHQIDSVLELRIKKIKKLKQKINEISNS